MSAGIRIAKVEFNTHQPKVVLHSFPSHLILLPHTIS